MDLRPGLNILFPLMFPDQNNLWLTFLGGICYLTITVSAVKLAPSEMKTNWIQRDHGARLQWMKA